MKALKIIGIVVLVFVVAIVIAMFIVPTDVQIERSVEIKAPKSLVHKHVSNLRLMNEWSPWAKMDPNMKNEYIGIDGTVGSINKWEGNDSVGKGEQEILFISDDTVKTQVRFKEPFESSADAYLVVEEKGPNTTHVIWGFKYSTPRPFNVMGLFMDMETTIGNDYQKGLDSLKAIAEREALASQNQTYQGFKIEETTLPETHIAYVKDTVKWADMKAYYTTHFGAIFSALGKQGKQPGVPSGLFYTWDEANQQADMAAGVAYTPAGKVAGYQSITLAGRTLKIDYFGSYEGSGAAHMAMEEYLKEKGLKAKTPVLEQYITDPGQEPDTSKWHTAIYYLLE